MMMMSPAPAEKPLVWLAGEVRTPPFSAEARKSAGQLLRQLQQGEIPPFPWSRPMPSLAPRCHELRIRDRERSWRIVYRIDLDAVVVLSVFPKTTAATPKHVLENCRRRLRRYDSR
jgi:phage-related protein